MDFKDIVLNKDFEKAVIDFGFSEFTEIQQKCIPLIQQGKDVIGLSYTGSGKTVAFGIPSLEKVIPFKGLQLLVVVPTRELCNQVFNEFLKFTKYRKAYIVEIYGGVAINPQIRLLRQAEVVIGTPGRLLDHLARRTLNLNSVKILVLDEADKMFEMGFVDDIIKIISQTPKNCQKLLFSATMSSQINTLVRKYMTNPESVKMQTHIDESKIVQHYYDVERKDKFSLLTHIIKKDSSGLVLVFCSTRSGVDFVNRNLNKQGIKSKALHGGLSQNMRNQVMQEFRDGKLDVLVASDVAARGIDVKNIGLIVNYDISKTSHEYIHRIGRTARAGSEGKVVSLLSVEDHDNFSRVLQDRLLSIEKMKTPEFERVEYVKNNTFKPDNFRRSFHGRFSRSGRETNRSRR